MLMKGNDNMKIAMIGHKRIPSREGGVEIVVEELSKRLVKKGHSVTAYNRKGHHISGKEFDCINNEDSDNFEGIKVVTVPTIEYKGLAAVTSSFFATIKAIFYKYDCIHYHAEGPCVMLIISHLFGIRTVATIHGLDWARSKWGGFATCYLKLGEKIAAKYADEIIVLSDNIKKYFENTYNRKTVYIPNGINKAKIKECNLIKQKWGLKKDSYILFVGRIVPEKGVQYLIDAFKQVDTDKQLVIAGGASDTSEFMKKTIETAKDDKRIIFTGFVQGEILEELYSNAYLYTLPSDLEGMPISLLEAMSYGNCCLVSDIPECLEVVQNKAAVFKKSSVEDLEKKLQILCCDFLLVNKYKNSASNFICSRYNWDSVINDTLQLYYKESNEVGIPLSNE
ncbi:glycosyltransferase family 4 protein [Clostridium butyricum]|uniref:Glycosyl transferase, group 1 n=1 Tax=Clostridium butyricum E4 str. BoNT E BL5262 TaxID=632245 RepID=C4IDA3_CLOBU|nr:glycosyltransferase family 4 protein [Clostridium butyricum]EDT76664.1 glycosyl transferase, group 1 [Clostridium butyricum 5521]EEP55823.1 glycosyl transferase, group 1 [Clostridium butyricum E4 str. BoNT E BL5262]NFL31853.1 glycosyltransferase family 4 protein [Clostridium butyricum]NFS19763.1 glycosyltransferase family 4 protein [Clostridium butyricum]